MDLICTTAEAAELLHLNRQTVDRQIKQGVYKHYARVGRRYLINLTREFPELFGDREAADAATSTAKS